MFKKFLTTCDYFSTQMNFHINGEDSYKTSFGGLMTIISFIVLALLIYSFGEDFFLRINPRYMQQTIYPERYNNYTINNKNFSFAFRIEDLNGLIIDKPDLIYIDFVYFNYEIHDGGWTLKEKKSIEYSKCQKKDFGKEEEYDKLDFKNWFCPKLNNITVGGNWDESYIKFFRIFVYKCSEGSKNHLNGKQCGSNKDFINANKERLFFSTFYQKYFIDPGNYESPFNIMYSTTFNMIDTLIMKRNLYYFKHGSISTDYGWIFKSFTYEEGFTLNNIFSDSMSISLLPEKDNNMMFESGIYFTRETEYYSRSFSKIQDLAATVGGIIKVFLLITGIIVNYYNKKSILFDIMIKNYDYSNILDDSKINISQLNLPKYNNLKSVTNEINIQYQNPKTINNLISGINHDKNITTKLSNLSNHHDNDNKLIIKQFLNFSHHLCSCISKKNNQYYKLIMKSISMKFDIYEYLRKCYDISNIKEFCLDEFKITCLQHLRKESAEMLIYQNYVSDDILNKDEFIRILVSNYKNKNELTKLDLKLLKRLPSDIVSSIY